MQLTTITTLEAKLELLTGLRIGAGDAEMHIGGLDNTVIKHPLTQEPYIPGSSLKGKMRSLLEWRSGAVQEGLKLIEHDSLGGSGSRGYGKVRFAALKIDGQDAQSRFDQVQAFPR